MSVFDTPMTARVRQSFQDDIDSQIHDSAEFLKSVEDKGVEFDKWLRHVKSTAIAEGQAEALSQVKRDIDSLLKDVKLNNAHALCHREGLIAAKERVEMTEKFFAFMAVSDELDSFLR